MYVKTKCCFRGNLERSRSIGETSSPLSRRTKDVFEIEHVQNCQQLTSINVLGRNCSKHSEIFKNLILVSFDASRWVMIESEEIGCRTNLVFELSSSEVLWTFLYFPSLFDFLDIWPRHSIELNKRSRKVQSTNLCHSPKRSYGRKTSRENGRFLDI